MILSFKKYSFRGGMNYILDCIKQYNYINTEVIRLEIIEDSSNFSEEDVDKLREAVHSTGIPMEKIIINLESAELNLMKISIFISKPGMLHSI